MVSSETLNPYGTLEEAVGSLSDFAEYVVSGREMVCLTRKGEKDWSIETVPIKTVAEAMLGKK